MELEKSIETIEGLSEFTVESLDSSLKALAKELGFKVGGLFVCLRISVLGKKATPPLFESFLALGKDETLKRLNEAYLEVESTEVVV